MNQTGLTSTSSCNAPINAEEHAPHLPHQSSSIVSKSTDPSPSCILAIDDDPAVLSSISRLLRRSRLSVLSATSGGAALKKLGPWLPELVLLDVSMPTMSGQTFLRRFRKAEQLIHEQRRTPAVPVPVMFVTAHSGHRQRIDGLKAGAVDYLIKPLDPEEFRARVCSQLRHYRRTRMSLLQATHQPSDLVSGAAA